jgi:hypothetical protein
VASLGTVDFEDSTLGVGLVKDGLALGEADEQSAETDAVEMAG